MITSFLQTLHPLISPYVATFHTDPRGAIQCTLHPQQATHSLVVILGTSGTAASRRDEQSTIRAGAEQTHPSGHQN